MSGLSTPIGSFGIASFTPYSLITGKPFGIVRVLGAVNISSEVELVDLNGGSSLDTWAVERGLRNTEVSLTFREYPKFLWELLQGSSPVDIAAEPGGGVVAIENAEGTSVVAATGIASVAIETGKEADAKYAVYVVEAVSATTVNVYGSSNVDFGRGTSETFEDDALLLNAAPITITTGAAVSLLDFGVEITGGAGTIAMVTGDTAVFEARPINNGGHRVTVGSTDECFVNFGAHIYAQKDGDGGLHYFNMRKLVGAGLPFAMTEKAWSEAEITLKAVRARKYSQSSLVTGDEALYEYEYLKSQAVC